jgi:L-alanine-DL-glutamate epimerase-like enolase superfamily enzyme
VIRAHAGKDFVVCLDGHMSNPSGEGQTSWDAGIAKAVLSALEPYELFFFEEPLHYNNVSGYAELRRNTATPVAGGEALTSREEFWQYAQADAFDIAQPDAAFIGIWAFLDVARMFANLNKRVATHAWASGAGVMQNIHAAFATPNMAILETPPLPGPLHTEVYADGYRFQDGYMLPPHAPGLGVRLTDSLKAKYPFVRGSGEFNVVPGKTMWL